MVNIKNLTVSVTGLSYSNCASTIWLNVRKLPGVENANVDFASEKLTISFDHTKISEKEIIACVRRIGYDVATEKIELPTITRLQNNTDTLALDTRSELQKAYDEIELRVKIRTEELVIANKSLQDEINERKKAEEAMRLSEEYFRNIFEYSTVGKSITSLDGKIRSNKTFCDILGYSEEELSSMNWRSITHPDDIETNHKNLELIISGEKHSMRWEKRYIHKDGHIIWVDISTVLQRDKEQNPLYFITTIQNITDRKLAEEALRENEERYRLITSVVSDYIFTSRLDDSGKLTTSWKTGAFEKITGYSLDEYIAAGGWRGTLHPDDWEKDNHDMEELLKNHQVVTDVRTYAKNGNIVWVRVYAHPLWDFNNNKLVGIYGGVKDITESKLAENALAISETRLRTLIQTIPDLIWLKDVNGVYLSCNPVFERFFGAKEAEIVGNTDYDFIDPGLADAFRKNDRKVMEAGKTISNEEWITFANDGHRILIETSKTPMYDSKGTLIGVLGIGHDITDRKLTEEALKESERLLRESQTVAHLGSYVWNLSNGLWASSKILDEIFGINENYTHSFDAWMNIIHPEWQKIMSNYVTNDVLEKHQRFDKEYQIIRQNDGQDRWVHGIGTLEFDNDNRPIKLIGTISDITDRKQTEEEIRKLNQTLEQRVIQRTAQLEMANKELEAFSYSVSHDLRAPLRHINGFINLFLEHKTSQLTDEELGFLKIVTNSTNEMGELIDALLSFSRLNRAELRKNPIDTLQMIQQGLKIFEDEIKVREIEIKIEPLPETYGDYQLISQVWINLLSNAIKYTGKKEKAIIEIGSFVENNETTFFVKDNGAGFNMKYADKLFSVFQRLHRPRDFEGIGIGLANINRIITRHGGHCWAEGEVDKGATFYFSVPVM